MNTLIKFFEKNGQNWTPAPFTGKRMERKECFSNALHYALDNGLRYVEGYGLRIVPIHHAWCVTEDGVVVDPTWDRPEECTYRGVAFDAEDARMMVMERGQYCLFETDEGPNWNLIEAHDREFREAEERKSREVMDFLKNMYSIG